MKKNDNTTAPKNLILRVRRLGGERLKTGIKAGTSTKAEIPAMVRPSPGAVY